MAVSDQGLSWGISKDQETKYTLDVNMTLLNSTTSNSYDMSVVIDSVPDIPPNVTMIAEIPLPEVTLKFANGTEFINIAGQALEGPFVMPIGNWSLMTDLIDAIFGNLTSNEFTWISDSSYWGYNITHDDVYPTIISFKSSRSDGVLSYMYVGADMGVNGEYEFTMQRLGSGLALDSTTLLIIGGGAVGLVVVVLVAFKLKR